MPRTKTFLAVACGVLLCACDGAFADVGGSAGAFMKLPIGSARAMALGHAYTALAEGIDGMAWNPAALGLTQQREMEFSRVSWFQDYGGSYAAYAQPVGPVTIGVNLAYMSVDGFDVRDVYGMPQYSESVTVNNMFGSVGVGRSFFTDKLSLGGAIKRVSESNDGSNYASMVMDLGAQLRLFDSVLLGVSLQNMGAPGDVVQMTRIGAAWKINSVITVSGESETPSDSKTRRGLGLEITLPESMLQVGRFTFRGGYYETDDTGTNYDDGMMKTLGLTKVSNFSMGAGIYSNEMMGYGIGLDFAVAPYGALGKATQISLKVSF